MGRFMSAAAMIGRFVLITLFVACVFIIFWLLHQYPWLFLH